MRRRSLPTELLPVRRAVRVFVGIDLAAVVAQGAWAALAIDPIVLLVLAPVGAAWLVADMGAWAMERSGLSLRRVIAIAEAVAAVWQVFLPKHGHVWGQAPPWAIGTHVAIGTVSIGVTTWALDALARVRRGPPGCGAMASKMPDGHGVAPCHLPYSHGPRRS